MSTIQKFTFTLDQISNVQFNAEKMILTFTFGDATQDVYLTPKDNSSSVEFIEFSDNKVLSLLDIADAFDLPEIATAMGASPRTNGLAQYDDNAGNLINGINRLGTLEPLKQASNVEDRNLYNNNRNNSKDNNRTDNNGNNNNSTGNNGNDNNSTGNGNHSTDNNNTGNDGNNNNSTGNNGNDNNSTGNNDGTSNNGTGNNGNDNNNSAGNDGNGNNNSAGNDGNGNNNSTGNDGNNNNSTGNNGNNNDGTGNNNSNGTSNNGTGNNGNNNNSTDSGGNNNNGNGSHSTDNNSTGNNNSNGTSNNGTGNNGNDNNGNGNHSTDNNSSGNDGNNNNNTGNNGNDNNGNGNHSTDNNNTGNNGNGNNSAGNDGTGNNNSNGTSNNETGNNSNNNNSTDNGGNNNNGNGNHSTGNNSTGNDDTDKNGNDGNNNNSVYNVLFHPDTSEVFESHLSNGTHVIHGEVVDQNDSYTKATGYFEIVGEGEYKGEATFSIGDNSVTIELPLTGESSTKYIGEDAYTITHETNGTYSYEYTLGAAKDHSGADYDSHGDKFIDTHIHVMVTSPTDNTVIASGDTAINIINDGLTASNPDTIILTDSSPHYVTIALDVSNSMDWSAEWGQHIPSGKTRGESRYDVAVKAIISLMEEYKNVSPDTQINLFLFNSNVQSINAHTPQDVIDYLNTHYHKFGGSGGGTNYKGVLDKMVGTVKEGIEHSDYTNQVIFISDGAADKGLDSSKSWHNLVTGEHAKDLDVFSVGIGNGINAEAQKNLKGVCNSEELGQTTGDMYVHVNDLHKLEETLHDVVNVTSGNLAVDNILGADGASSFYGFTVGDTEHKIDWTGNTDPIDSDGYYKIYLAGDENSENYTLMKIDSHGNYILQVHGSVEDATYNNIKLILEDTDGDRLTLSGNIGVVSPNGEIHHSSDTITVDDTHNLAASDDHTSNVVTDDTHSLSASDDHTSNVVTDDTHSLAASDDYTSGTDTDDVDIFNFAKQGQSSNADHANIFTPDSGSNLMNSFTLGEDDMSLEDILSVGAPLTLTSALLHLEEGSLGVEEISEHSSETIIALDEHESKTVESNFTSNAFSSSAASLEEQMLLLLKIRNG